MESRIRNEATGAVLLDLGLQAATSSMGSWSQRVAWEVRYRVLGDKENGKRRVAVSCVCVCVCVCVWRGRRQEGPVFSPDILCITKLYAVCSFSKLLPMTVLLTGLIKVY